MLITSALRSTPFLDFRWRRHPGRAHGEQRVAVKFITRSSDVVHDRFFALSFQSAIMRSYLVMSHLPRVTVRLNKTS